MDKAPLLPFRTFKGATPAGDKFWDSKGSRFTDTFGYTYPDLKTTVETDQKGYNKQVANDFVDRYKWTKRTSGSPFITGTPPEGRLDMSIPPVDSQGQVFQYNKTSKPGRMVTSAVAAAATFAQQASLVKDSLAGMVAEAVLESEPSEPTADQKAIAAQRSLKHMDPAEVAIADHSDVDESRVERQWYVDDSVERYA